MAFLMSWLPSWVGKASQASADTLGLAALPKREVNLEFLDDSDPKYKTEKPYYSNVPFTETDAPSTNVVSKKSRVTLHDIRGNENLFNLDTHGFELIKYASGFDQWQDGHKVVQEVYPRIVNLLKAKLGEDVRVIVFDHTLCRSRDANGSTSISQGDNFAPPSRVAHVDQTYEATVGQIRLDFKDEAEKILKSRFRITNVWHPIRGPVRQHPFVLCDYRTAKSDWTPCDLIYPHTITEIMVFRNSASQKWYFIDQQVTDEVWMFKIMDSKSLIDPNVAEFSAHTSFFDEDEALADLYSFATPEKVQIEVPSLTDSPKAQPWKEWLASEMAGSSDPNRPWLDWKPKMDDPSDKQWLHWNKRKMEQGCSGVFEYSGTGPKPGPKPKPNPEPEPEPEPEPKPKPGPTAEMMGAYPVINLSRI
ncbi:hypothetical protein NCS52_01416200 [Fusarium sp. LHS14.1]|nr:hypothetical protein NCS52_01416200 [Fusarium sp. LHS14.1]